MFADFISQLYFYLRNAPVVGAPEMLDDDDGIKMYTHICTYVCITV